MEKPFALVLLMKFGEFPIKVHLTDKEFLSLRDLRSKPFK